MSFDLSQYLLTGSMWSPMQILQVRNARSDLSMSNAARRQLGIQLEVVRNTDKHAALLTHELHVGQQVMHQDSTNKHWFPAVIDSLCPEPRCFKITTRDGITYRKTQSHLKPFTPQNKNFQSFQCVSPPMALLPICNQWKLSTRRSHKWMIKCKYRQTDLKEALSTLKCLPSEYCIYIVFS